MNRLGFIKSCGATLVLAATGLNSQAKGKKPEEKDFHVFDFPKKVQQTIMDFAGDGTIQEIAKKRQSVKTWVYTVKYFHNGQNLILTALENGRLVKIENADEEEPKKAAKTAEKKPDPETKTTPAEKPVADEAKAKTKKSKTATAATEADETSLDSNNSEDSAEDSYEMDEEEGDTQTQAEEPEDS
jgi:hypothetical protein